MTKVFSTLFSSEEQLESKSHWKILATIWDHLIEVDDLGFVIFNFMSVFSTIVYRIWRNDSMPSKAVLIAAWRKMLPIAPYRNYEVMGSSHVTKLKRKL